MHLQEASCTCILYEFLFHPGCTSNWYYVMTTVLTQFYLNQNRWLGHGLEETSNTATDDPASIRGPIQTEWDKILRHGYSRVCQCKLWSIFIFHWFISPPGIWYDINYPSQLILLSTYFPKWVGAEYSSHKISTFEKIYDVFCHKFISTNELSADVCSNCTTPDWLQWGAVTVCQNQVISSKVFL